MGMHIVCRVCRLLHRPNPFSIIFHLRDTHKMLSAASSSVYRVLLIASQASDVGSIPIARSRYTEDKQVTLRLTPIHHLTPIQRLGVRFFRLDRELLGAAN